MDPLKGLYRKKWVIALLVAKKAVTLAVIFFMSSCVSNKVFNSMKAEALRLDSELEAANTRVSELEFRNRTLEDEIARLKNETTRLEADNRTLDQQYKKLLSDGSAEAGRMLRQLEQSQRELNEHLDRVAELEQLLRAREEALAGIRSKVADALLGFEGKGLSISTREGKVYVSMEDKLLFRSGSFDIDPNGAQAVRDLAVVLAQNPDISIMVEGHTDDVPYRPNGNLRDNLDLSAKRATTVVRLLLENEGIAPERVIAAGRGEWLPIDAAKTTEARAKNRRTEIILSPKLDELMQLLDKS